MARKKITLRDEKPEMDTVSEDDAAAAVSAPGQETFKTPDVSEPTKDSASVSDESSERFSEGNVDWNKALEDADNAPEVEEVVSVVEEAPSAEVVAVSDDEPAKDSVVEPEVDPSDAITEPKEEAVIEEEFQPELDIEPVQIPQEELDKDYTEKREAAVSQIMERYTLTEEQRDQALTNPEELLPRMAAQVYVDVYESVLGAVSQMLPERVNNINAKYMETQKNTKQFFEKWPSLNNLKGMEEATRIGSVYRQLNKSASAEEFIKAVGIQTSIALGVEIPGVAVEAPAQAEDAPAFTPAGSGAVGETPKVPVNSRESTNQFERLNASWDE